MITYGNGELDFLICASDTETQLRNTIVGNDKQNLVKAGTECPLRTPSQRSPWNLNSRCAELDRWFSNVDSADSVSGWITIPLDSEGNLSWTLRGLACDPRAIITWWFWYFWANTILPHHQPPKCFSLSGSLYNDELWWTSVIHAVGPLLWTFHSGVPLLSAIEAISSVDLAFTLNFAIASSASFACVNAALGAFLASLLSSIISSATRLLISSFYHVPAPTGPFLHAPLPALYPFHAIAHTSSYNQSLPASESLCVVFVSCVTTFPTSVAWSVFGHHFIDEMPSFCMISSNFFDPVSESV